MATITAITRNSEDKKLKSMSIKMGLEIRSQIPIQNSVKLCIKLIYIDSFLRILGRIDIRQSISNKLLMIITTAAICTKYCITSINPSMIINSMSLV